jgi:EmrB/QacA subfamily drug resistance transporter
MQTDEKKYILIVATLASFLTPFMGSSINVALPQIGAEFNAGAVELTWVATAFLLSSAVFLVPMGRIADIFGRKKLFRYGILIYTLTSFFSALSPKLYALIILRAFQGIGGAMIFGTGMALLTSAYPPNERGRVLGINVAAVYIGLSLGPFVGGMLTQSFGWRSTLAVNVPLGLIVIAVTYWKLKGECKDAKDEPIDVTGAVLFGLVLLLLSYGLSRLPHFLGGGLILASGAMLLFFLYWERKVAYPILDLSLFRKNPVFIFSNLAAFIHYTSTAALGLLLSLYLQLIKGLNPREAGFILVSQPIAMALVSPLAGRISDKFEPRIVASIGMAATSLALGLFHGVNAGTSMTYIISCSLLLGVGFALFSSPNTNAVMGSVEKKHYGVASGVIGTMRLVGQLLSMSIVTLIFSLMMGSATVTSANQQLYLDSFHTGIKIFTLLCVVGIGASLSRGRMHGKRI